MLNKLILLICAVATVKAIANYCDPSLCGSLTHIACNNNGSWASTCPENAKMMDLSTLKDQIVANHNTKRNLIAGGGLTGYSSATKMATMQWNDELASIAAFNVKRCVMEHDECRNTNDFKYSGQNLAIFGYSGIESGYSDSYIITFGIDSWWNEYKDCNQTYIDSFPTVYKGEPIGHFTLMTAARNVALGCAAARYFDGTYNWVIAACNYATTNIYGWSMYQAGPTAVACVTGTNPSYPNLCSTSETYDYLT